MRKEDILEYVNRDWEAIAASKLRWRAEQRKTMTAAEALAHADGLRRHALALHPDWPTEQHRREDFETHIRVAEMLSRVQPQSRR